MFDSYALDDAGTVDTIRQVHADTGYLLDPHTAIGVAAARATRRSAIDPMVTLGTAHPVKFADAIAKAGQQSPELPHHLSDLMQRPERYSVLPADLAKVQAHIADTVFG